MSERIAVIAHRGASGLAGEDNTLRSFALAIDLGCHYAEFDVRRTRDALVCFHDHHIHTVPLAELTHAELRRCAAIDVPSLSQVLDFCRGRIGLDVEIKDPGIEADVVALLRPLRDDTPLLVKSFDTGVVARLVDLAPRCPVGLLVGGRPELRHDLAFRAALDECRRLGADFISPSHHLLADRADLRNEISAMPCYPWTVNAEHEMARLIRLPIAGLITDRPDLLIPIVRPSTNSC